ncbi:PVC-type heme-binding CxxCH protein [Planctomicrobium sp. SH664]|uniref:PVC-type heme-binding CxxCH protein n=1 Tax=Planctomicrobium sp. SH664 TaxID=3448125 RepID=UPI003F5C1760
MTFRTAVRFLSVLSVGIVLSLKPGSSLGADPKKFELLPNDRVVFLGAELTEQEIKHNFLEAALLSQWPDRNLTFRNLGWAGDIPTAVARGYFGGAAEGYRRLLEEIDRLQPTVVFVAYGENLTESTEEDLQEFFKGYTQLIQDLTGRKLRLVLLGPPLAEAKSAPLPDVTALNQSRRLLGDRLRKFADEHQLPYVDRMSPAVDTLPQADHAPLTYDTIRYTAAGYRRLAQVTLFELGLASAAINNLDAELLKLIQRKNDLYFHQYRPQNETYLRGFRKYEQGQNAREIAEFDPLIQRAEERVTAHLLNQPVPPEMTLPEPAPLAFKPLTPEDQLKTFRPADGLEVRLFAAEPLISNPIQMNFDSRGRLWVASSPIYPQLRPGAEPNDSIVILEDRDGDGLAETRTVFAEGLLIPTAVLPDEQGGAFVANSTELLYLKDTDGDGVADERHVLLSGFGTEDTHHILHTFRWSPDVLLSFNQSIYIHSHIETPYGIERMLGSGIWRYRPQTARAAQVMHGLVNPWGLIFDRWGQSFATDGAGSDGINYAFPGAAYPSAVGFDRVLRGMNPGQPKHCGLEIISGRHFPETWQDLLVTADFRGNRINSFRLTPEKSGYISTQGSDLLTSSDRAFRPVDIKLAPDGTLYVADWHDSIINHGEVDFRDPRRDDRHGRIWRIVAKDRETLAPPQLETATISELLEMLKSPEQWTRQMARVQLTLRDPNEVRSSLDNWIRQLQVGDDQLRLEALWTGQALGQIPEELLREILTSTEPRARAAGIRALSQATQEGFGLPGGYDSLSWFEKAVADDHPQVRLEAVNALRAIGTVRAVGLAMRALDQPMDPYLDYALSLTMKRTQANWLPMLSAGKGDLADSPEKALFALLAVDNASTLEGLMKLLTGNAIPAGKLDAVLASVGKFAGPGDVQALFKRATTHPDERQAILQALVTAASKRDVVPTGDVSGLRQFLTNADALRLAGYWKQKDLQPQLVRIATDESQSDTLRHGAIDGLAALKDGQALRQIGENVAIRVPIRRLAVVSLLSVSSKAAADQAVHMLQGFDEADSAEITALLEGFLSAKSGPRELARALEHQKIPAAVASLGIRVAESKGNRGIPVVDALRTAGGLTRIDKSLTAEQMTALLKEVEAAGNPARGEVIYRRKELTCMNCHSIGGAGGLVGPDMLSLGASSPVDYIVQSLLEPSAKIKEGYHTVSIATTDGKVLNGVLVREGSDNVVIRDAQGKELTIPTAEIDERVMSPVSIMPADLTGKLARDEFVDLVAFLSALGKEGKYKVPQNRFVRRWTTPAGEQILSQVNGQLAATDFPAERSVLFTLQVTTPGKIGLKVNSERALYLTLDGADQNLLAEKAVTVVDLPAGLHTFKLSMFGHRRDPISIEIIDLDGEAGHAEVVNR